MEKIKIGKKSIGPGEPSYIIAEIGSNFDGDIDRAKYLIDLAKKSGADAVKFQSFTADTIVSRDGFEGLNIGFQKKWKKPVYEVYKDAELPNSWLKELFSHAKRKNIEFLSAPYNIDAADILNEMGINAFKIGSGDITWVQFLEYIASKEKPIIMGTGASYISEIDEAIQMIRNKGNEQIVLLQCVTNYPSSFESANIRAMEAMGNMFNTLVGYSDHTPGSIVPVGAVSRGACVIEKHFTDDKSREGPDHPFAMDNIEFKNMVKDIRNLEKAMGSPNKTLYDEEKKTVFLQRRCLRASRELKKGTFLKEKDLTPLRPLGKDYIEPKNKNILIGKELKKKVKKGDIISWEMV